jgi:Putative  PD-(D/E)XK family member, (DUF4420)
MEASRVTHLAEDVWARLGTDVPMGEELTARLAAPDVTERLLAGIDAEGRRHLLIHLRPADVDMRDMQSRGLWVVTSDLLVSGREPGRYIDLVCNDLSGYDALDIIGGELSERLASEKEGPADLVARVLAKWRRFWGQLPRDALSREAQLGLFAEVWFMTFWLLPQVATLEATNRWRGPFGARHDFEWPGRSIEVKATTSTRGLIHRINGIDQLAPPEAGDLLLFSLQLREEAGATHCLPDLIGECRSKLEVDDGAVIKFETGLAQVGYSPAHDDEYAKMRVRVVEEGLYEVEGDFPRLTVAQLSTGLPSGVEHVEYEINLGGFKHLLAAKDPTATVL